MNCSNCGSNLSEDMSVCPVCGQPVRSGAVLRNSQRNDMDPGYQTGRVNPGYGTQAPPSWSFGVFLALSVLEILFTGILFGILALIWSFKANTAYNAGDYDKFYSHKKTAVIFLIIGLVLGIIIVIAQRFIN